MTAKNVRAIEAGLLASAASAVPQMFEATVALVDAAGAVAVQTPDGPRPAASLALGRALEVGDRVLVSGVGSQLYVLGVVGVAASEVLVTRDGARAERVSENGVERLRVRDGEGRTLFEYDTTTHRAVVSVPAGDLALRAEQGSVEVYGAKGVRVASGAAVELAHEGGEATSARVRADREGVQVEGPALRVGVGRAEATVDELRATARRVDTAFEQLRQRVGVLEVNAGRILERARATYREVEGVAQSRVGRFRVLAREAMHLSAQRATVSAREDVKLDGKQILLG